MGRGHMAHGERAMETGLGWRGGLLGNGSETPSSGTYIGIAMSRHGEKNVLKIWSVEILESPPRPHGPQTSSFVVVRVVRS